MIHYIGIRGHRGSGKNTISYLLGVSIDYYFKHNKSLEGFEETFNAACNRVTLDEDFLKEAEFDKVYFEGFADTPKILLSQLIGIPSEWMWSDWKKDSVFINMKDFSSHECKDKLEVGAFLKQPNVFDSADKFGEYMSLLSNGLGLKSGSYIIKNDCYLSLRELIIYFGKEVMQQKFGIDVWVKSLKSNDLDRDSFFAANKTMYKIFTDVKFPSEVSYIKDRKGFIIEVFRPSNVKEDTVLSYQLSDDRRVDFTIEIGDRLEDLRSQIESLTLKIINND